MNHLSEADILRFGAEALSGEPLAGRFVNEARFGLSRILPILATLDRDRAEILEVGAGSCLLSAYLASRGWRVTAVEPLGPEFGFFQALQDRVLAFAREQGATLDVVRRTGETIDFRDRFAFAYTINALEHMTDPLKTIDTMIASLQPGGILLAHCPNYTIPFEVHYNLLLVTRSKRINERLYGARIGRDPAVWNELNFIRQADLRRHLRRRGAPHRFNRSVLSESVRRLLQDPIFAERMPFPVRAAGAVMKRLGLVPALALLPARLQTPMEVVVTKPQPR